VSFYYLASPYTHPDPEVRHQRYVEMERICAEYLRNGIYVYSPIVHCHYIALNHDLPVEFDFWMGYNKSMMLASRGMIVIQLDGWSKSKGVAAEIEFCTDNNISVIYVDPKGTTY
jgi:hypothetical protein